MNDEARQAIISLADKNGGTLQPEEVVASARDRGSPLHGLFEWDDAAAAEQHRLTMARGLIRSVRIEVTVTELRIPMRVPLFARNVDAGGYATVALLRQDDDRARAAATAEFEKAATALRRARQTAIALGLGAEAVTTIDSLIRGIDLAERNFPQSA